MLFLCRYDYKIQYNDISKLFLLEKPDERYVAFVVSLDKPIRQGQQKYQHLVLRTTKVLCHKSKRSRCQVVLLVFLRLMYVVSAQRPHAGGMSNI